MSALPYEWNPPTKCLVCGNSELFDGFALCLEHALEIWQTQGDEAVLKFSLWNMEHEVRSQYLVNMLRKIKQRSEAPESDVDALHGYWNEYGEFVYFSDEDED